jgi:hypothetical protein
LVLGKRELVLHDVKAEDAGIEQAGSLEVRHRDTGVVEHGPGG